MKKPIGQIFKALLGMVVLLCISYIIYYYVSLWDAYSTEKEQLSLAQMLAGHPDCVCLRTVHVRFRTLFDFNS